jgi:tetratricopeptide (TPR) repeat protein
MTQSRPRTPLVPIPGGRQGNVALALTRAMDEETTSTMTAPVVPLAPGAMLGNTRYRIDGWLGEGGMGVVYAAEHVDLKRKVALKLLRSEACRRPHHIDMLRGEAQTIASLRSDYIVDIYDFAELADGRALFTMELLQGTTLHQAIAWGPLEVSRAIGVLRQICKGLAVAHAAGVVHRDIKPENVFLSRRGDRTDAVRLLDFGVAAMLGETRLGRARVAGTPCYFAPELVAGTGHDARVDLYALGCTAFEILVGRPPFDGDADEVVLAHLDREPPRFAEIVPNRPELAPLEVVVRRCLEKDPQARYASAAAVEAALCEAQIAMGVITPWDDLPLPDVDRALRDRLVAGMPDPAAFREHRQRWRRRRWQILSGVSALALSIGLALAWPSAHSQAHIDDLVNSARHAAALAYFVYPPPDEPKRSTAYDYVLELEAMSGISGMRADRRADELREELASTLVRLGDRYWSLDGGRVFAIDYYACALVFEPDHPVARERAVLTIGQIASLQHKAAQHSFTDVELAAASPLLALAEEDVAERERKLLELEGLVGRPSATIGAELDRLFADEHVIVPKPQRGRAPASPRVVEPPSSSSVPAPVAESAAAPAVVPAAAEPDPALPVRPRVATAPLLAAGRRALQRGDLDGAEAAFEKVLAADPKSAVAHGSLARVEFERGRYVVATRHAQSAVRLAPRDAGHRILLGDALYKSYRYADAVAQYERAADLGHADAAARIAKAKAKAG